MGGREVHSVWCGREISYLVQRTSSHKLHDDGQFGWSLAGSKEQDNVGVTETVHDKHFSFEGLHCLWSGPTSTE